MRAFIDRLFRTRPKSKEDAKSRLKLILMHDQVDLTPTQLERMKAEIIEVISRYVEVDDSHVEFKLDRADDGVQLVSSVPVRRVTARA
jgi:cell division topological specificity factor